ncbi:hypothetical protein [Thermodesulfobium sp.]
MYIDLKDLEGDTCYGMVEIPFLHHLSYVYISDGMDCYFVFFYYETMAKRA